MTFTPNFSAPSSLPPQAIEVEEAILGGILLDPGAISRVADTLIPEAFWIDSHKEIYRAALAIYRQGIPVDLMSVCQYLHDRQRIEKIGGQQKLAELVGDVVSAVNIDHQAALVMDKYRRRQLIEAGHEIAQLAHETWLSQESLREQIENKLLGKKGLLNGFGSEDQRSIKQHQKLIAAVEKIELTIENPSLKLWEYKRIASKFGATVKELQNLWYHHLIGTNEGKLESLEDIQVAANEVMGWMLHGFLPEEGLVLLHAAGGVGKTRLFYDWAFCLAAGQPWNGIFNVTQPKRRILFVQTDESALEISLALDALGFNKTHDIAFYRGWSVENMAGLNKKIDEFNPDLLMIDSLNSVSTNCLISENDAEYARPVLALRKLSETTKKLIFLIHHSNKEGDVRGSSAIKAACSMEMKLARDSKFPDVDSTRRILTIAKTRCYRRPAEYDIELDPESGKWTWLGEHGKEENSEYNLLLPIKDRIVNFLSAHRNQRFEHEELHQEVGGGFDSVRRAAYQLASDGIISRVKKGKRNLYFLIWEEVQMNHRSDQQPSMISDDQIDDQLRNDEAVRVSESSDHAIAKNSISDAPVEAKKMRSHDQMEEIKASTPLLVSDTATDPPTDPLLIHQECDREFTSAQNEGETAQEPLPVSDSSGEQVPESCNDSVTNEGEICDRGGEGDREITPESNSSLQIKVGQWGRIKGLGHIDGLLVQAIEAPCPNGSLLAKDQDGAFYGVLPSALDNFAPLSHRECLERGLNYAKPDSAAPTHPPYSGKNLPRKGDRIRCHCENGKAGRVVKVRSSSPKYIISWEDGREMHYELEDFGKLDIRRES